MDKRIRDGKAEVAQSVRVLSDGNILVGCVIKSSSGINNDWDALMIKLNSDGDFMESVTARFEETVAFYSSVIDEGKMIFCGAELNDQKMDMDGVIFKMTLPVTISKRYVYPRNTALKEPVVSIYDLFGRHINSGKYSRKNSSGIYVVTGEKKRSIVSVNLRNSGNGTNVFPLHPSF